MDKDFYKFFNIEAANVLSDCSYFNLYDIGYEYGDDVCEHMDDDITCKECPKSEKRYEHYPPITDDIIVNLILICGLPVPPLSCYYNTLRDKQIILDFVKNKVQKCPDLFNRIQILLQAHVYEYTRL